MEAARVVARSHVIIRVQAIALLLAQVIVLDRVKVVAVLIVAEDVAMAVPAHVLVPVQALLMPFIIVPIAIRFVPQPVKTDVKNRVLVVAKLDVIQRAKNTVPVDARQDAIRVAKMIAKVDVKEVAKHTAQVHVREDVRRIVIQDVKEHVVGVAGGI